MRKEAFAGKRSPGSEISKLPLSHPAPWDALTLHPYPSSQLETPTPEMKDPGHTPTIPDLTSPLP